MPWIHVDWGAEGNLNRIVLTDDDADVIAECTNMRIERDGPERAHLQMDFIVPSIDKFNEATIDRALLETETKTAKKKEPTLKNKLSEIRKEEQDTSWEVAKWRDLSWRRYYDEISHDLDGMSKDDLLDEAEWCELEIPKSILKNDLRKAILEKWADDEYARHRKPRKKSKVKP